jgi:hypothetical protein
MALVTRDQREKEHRNRLGDKVEMGQVGSYRFLLVLIGLHFYVSLQ